MTVYFVILFLILCFFAFFKNKKKSLTFSFFFIILISSLRKYTVGVDTEQFYKAFISIGNDSTWNYLNFRYELGFYYLCKVLYIIFKSPQSLIIFTSIFINYSVYRFIKKNSSNYFLSTLLYLSMNIFFSYMNIMRQAIAVAILLYGFNYVKEKKYIQYFVIVFIAYLFHKVAIASILLIVFSILPKKRMSYFLEICIALATFVLYKKFFYTISSFLGYSDYANGDYGVSNYFAAVLKFSQTFVVTISLYFVAYFGKKDEKDEKIKLLLITTIIYLWFQLLSIQLIIFNRIYSLYSAYLIIMIPELLMKIREQNFNNYMIMKYFILILYFSSFLIIGKFRPEWFGVIPYMFFWQ